MTELESFACSGTDKEAFIKALDFITGINEYDTNGFFIDTTGYLVFCKYISENKQNEMAYPFKQTSISLAEHAFSYLESLSDDDLRKMGAEPSGYEESYNIGFELFTLDWYSDEHKINRYTWGKTVLAVKPKLIEYGK